jgi:hypothetical protein
VECSRTPPSFRRRRTASMAATPTPLLLLLEVVSSPGLWPAAAVSFDQWAFLKSWWFGEQRVLQSGCGILLYSFRLYVIFSDKCMPE